MNKNGQYRFMQPMQIRTAEKDQFIVEGYATTFEPYLYYVGWDGREIYEHFSRECFDGVDLSDVIMQFDHQGRVFARTGNASLSLSVDERGLKVVADLSRTSLSRQLFEDIDAGMITKMSWGFLPAADPLFDRNTNTIVWRKGDIREVLDVSAVSLPANDDTSISARCQADMDAVIQRALLNEQNAQKVREAEMRDADIRIRMRIRGKR